MTKNKEIKMIPLNLITPDEHQPRKNFNASRLGELMKSIGKYGIMNPIIIEKKAGGLYMLIDGERRYRAAKELELKEVPAIVEDEQKDTDSLIQQFHIQEQHEGWTPVEKAIGVTRLAKELGVGINDVAEMLSLSSGTISDYMAFGSIANQELFQKYEVPVRYARTINNLKKFVKNRYSKVLDDEFDVDQQSLLEVAIIERFKDGVIVKQGDIIKIYDSVRANPRSIEKFIKTKITPQKLFSESNAKVAYHFRNINQNALVVAYHIREGIKLNVEKFYDEEHGEAITQLKTTAGLLNDLLKKIGA